MVFFIISLVLSDPDTPMRTASKR